MSSDIDDYLNNYIQEESTRTKKDGKLLYFLKRIKSIMDDYD